MITKEQFKKLKIRDTFWAIRQKDNNPFEKPFIRKFEIEEFLDNLKVLTTTKDRWGKSWVFRPQSICLTYEDALIEKQEILKKIDGWEKERKERDRIYFAKQQEKKEEKLKEYENKIREEERSKICGLVNVDIRSLFNSYASSLIDYCIWNKNADGNPKLYKNFKRIVNDRLVKVLDLFNKRMGRINEGGNPDES